MERPFDTLDSLSNLIKLHEAFAQTVHLISVDYRSVSHDHSTKKEPYATMANSQLDVDTMLSKSWVVPTEPRRLRAS